MNSASDKLANIISSEIAARPQRVWAAVELLDGGSTTPFIARYRKEATGGLELAAKIGEASTKAALEDLYLPYKPKRRTKAQIAIERGLGPLAETLLADRSKDLETEAAGYVGEDVPDTKAALEGARDILAEQFAEIPDRGSSLSPLDRFCVERKIAEQRTHQI